MDNQWLYGNNMGITNEDGIQPTNVWVCIGICYICYTLQIPIENHHCNEFWSVFTIEITTAGNRGWGIQKEITIFSCYIRHAIVEQTNGGFYSHGGTPILVKWMIWDQFYDQQQYNPFFLLLKPPEIVNLVNTSPARSFWEMFNVCQFDF